MFGLFLFEILYFVIQIIWSYRILRYQNLTEARQLKRKKIVWDEEYGIKVKKIKRISIKRHYEQVYNIKMSDDIEFREGR